MKLTFIRPNMNECRSRDALEPLAIAVLKGLTPPTVSTAFLDDRLEALPDRLDTNLAVLSVETFTARRAYGIADRLRQQGVRVLMGGIHPTLLPEEALAHCDSVLCGEAEPYWEEVLRDAVAGALKPRYGSAAPAAMGGVPYDRSLFAGKRYAPLRPVQFGRGCPHRCEFCAIGPFYGPVPRRRPVAEVAAELKALGPGHYFMVDDNFLTDREALLELCQAMIPLGIRWSGQISLEAAHDRELLQLLRASGCTALIIGFESLEAGNLQQMGKTVNLRWADYEQAVRNLYGAGIMIYGTFVIGYDHDTPETLERLYRFARGNRFMIANFNPLIPMPGTRLYERLQQEGRLLRDRWWLDPAFRYGQTVYSPRGMSPEALERACLLLRRRFYSLPAILGRLPEPRSNSRTLGNAALFCGVNLISRHEIRCKQGKSLG